MRIEGIKTVFVDLDDTIWWFGENSLLSLRHVYDLYGLTAYASYEDFDKHYHDINGKLWSLYHYGKIARDFLVDERFRYTLEKIGYPCDRIVPVGKEMNEEYLHFLSLQRLLVPWAKEMLEYLSRRYDVNVLSNGFKGVQQQKLRSGGIDCYINEVVLSDDCGVTKPLRGIFDYALERCGAQAETTVMIGDNYDTDVCGARNAGWRAVFFNRSATPGNYPMATAVVTSLAEVCDIL